MGVLHMWDKTRRMMKMTKKEEPLYTDYRPECTIKLWEGGKVTVDYGDKGKSFNVLEEAVDKHVRLELVDRYIQVLCNVQQSGHDVHSELASALSLYRLYAGL
jgi:hypothetical protein